LQPLLDSSRTKHTDLPSIVLPDAMALTKGRVSARSYSGGPVTVLDTPAEIEKARDLWTSWSGSRDSDIDFFLYIASIRPEVLRPYVLVHNRSGVADAMLIGRLEMKSIPVQIGYRKFKTYRLRVLTFVLGALRGNASEENIDLLVGQVLKSLRQREVDLAVFEYVPVDSPLYRVVRTLPGILERGLPPEHRTHRCLELPDSSEALYKILSPKHRQNYRGKARKLLKDFAGDVRIHCYRSVSELDQAFREIEEIAAKTYQRGLGFGFAHSPEMRGRCELAAAKGWLRVYVLHVAGKPCAYWHATAYRGTLWGEHIGFDPAFGRYSPGMYLSLSVIGEMCDQKKNHDIAQINFGPGDAEYKSVLSNVSFEEGRELQIYGRTWRALGVKALCTPVVFTDRLAKRILSKTKLLSKVKRLWRDRAARATGPQPS
jgi:hypothetical protein